MGGKRLLGGFVLCHYDQSYAIKAVVCVFCVFFARCLPISLTSSSLETRRRSSCVLIKWRQKFNPSRRGVGYEPGCLIFSSGRCTKAFSASRSLLLTMAQRDPKTKIDPLASPLAQQLSSIQVSAARQIHKERASNNYLFLTDKNNRIKKSIKYGHSFGARNHTNP